MLNQRHGSVSGGVVRPSPYTLFDSAARNAWLDNLQRKIQRGLHPQASPGPSRSPSPFEITESRPVELVEAHQDEQDELFGGELEGEHVGVDEGELQELELEYGEPSKSAGGLADNMLGKEIGGTSESGQAPVGAAIHSGDWVDGLEGYVEDHPGREANGYGLSLEPIYENDDHYDEVYDDEDGEDSEEEEEMEEGGEEDAEVQYIGSSMDENSRSSSDDADGSDEEYEKNSEGDSEGDYKPVSIYPQLPGETDDGMEEILQQEPLALPSTCIPPGQGLDYSSQSIYPQLENLPTHVLIPSPAALPADAPFAYGPELVGIPDELVDPALLTEIAQQAEAAIPPAFYPEEIALSMDDAMKEAKEMDGEEEHYEGESFHADEPQTSEVSPSQMDVLIDAMLGSPHIAVPDEMLADNADRVSPEADVIEVLSSDGEDEDDEEATEREEDGETEEEEKDVGEEEEEAIGKEDGYQEDGSPGLSEKLLSRSSFTPGEVIDVDSGSDTSILDDDADEEQDRRTDSASYERDRTPEPVIGQWVEQGEPPEELKPIESTSLGLAESIDVAILEVREDERPVHLQEQGKEEIGGMVEASLPVMEDMPPTIKPERPKFEVGIDTGEQEVPKDRFEHDAANMDNSLAAAKQGIETFTDEPHANESSMEGMLASPRDAEQRREKVSAPDLTQPIESSAAPPPGSPGPNRDEDTSEPYREEAMLPSQEIDADIRIAARPTDTSLAEALVTQTEPPDTATLLPQLDEPEVELVHVDERATVDAISGVPTDMPDHHLPPRDSIMPLPFLLQDPETRARPIPSLIVEPPAEAPQPDSVPVLLSREETPPNLPDPYQAPADSSLPNQRLNAEDFDPTGIPSPSMVVEPPSKRPAPDSVDIYAFRAETPPVLPDPHAAPPDTTQTAPIFSPRLSGIIPTPSLIVEPPTDMPIAATSIVASRLESSTPMTKTHIAPPGAERIIPESPHGVESTSSPSGPILVHSAEDRNRTEVQRESVGVSLETETGTPHARPISDNLPTTANDLSTGPMALLDIDEPLFQTQASRLRHHHGALGQDVRPSLDKIESKIRSHTRRSTSPVPSLPVTRSHCTYRKLRISDEELVATILVPHCTLADAERLREGEWEDAGDPSTDEERDAKPHALTYQRPLIHPRLAAKLHRIVGKNIFDEGHCFLSYASDGASAQDVDDTDTRGAHRNSRKRKSAEPADSDDEDNAIDVRSTPAIPTARATRRTRRRAAIRTPETSTLAVTRSQKRNVTRSVSRSTAMATDEEGSTAQTPTPAAHKTPPTAPILSLERRQTRTSTARAKATQNEESETEREATPVPTASSRKRKSRKSAPGKKEDAAMVVKPDTDGEGSVMSAIEAAPLKTTSTISRGRRSAAAEQQDSVSNLDEDDEARKMTPTPGPVPASSSERKLRSSASPKKQAAPAAKGERAETPTKAAEPSSPPSHSTRKRKFRLSATEAKEDAPWRAFENEEAEEHEGDETMATASTPIRETRSMKRQAVASSAAPNVPVTRGTTGGAEKEDGVQVETSTTQTPRRQKRGILGKMLRWGRGQ